MVGANDQLVFGSNTVIRSRDHPHLTALLLTLLAVIRVMVHASCLRIACTDRPEDVLRSSRTRLTDL